MKKFYITYCTSFLFTLVLSSLIANGQNNKTPDIGLFVPENACAPATISFENKSRFMYDTTNIRYRWYMDNNSSAFFIGYCPQPKVFSGGYHNIRVEADSAGQFRGSVTKDFSIKDKPNRFFPVNSAQFCPGEELTFRIEDDIKDILWDFGDGPIFDGSNKNNWVRHIYKTTGPFNVKAIYNSTCGSDTLRQTVVISPSANPTVNARIRGNWSACINDDIIFGTDEKYVMYTWTFGDGSSSNLPNPGHAYSATGNYPVILTAKNSCGSTGTDTVFVTIGNNIPTWAAINYWFKGNGCPNTPVNFQTNSSGKYQWSFGDGGTSSLREPINTYADTGRYKVRLIVTNGCGKSDTVYNMLTISTQNAMPPNQPFIKIWTGNDDNSDQSDTLKVCPGEPVKFRNTSWDDGVKYKWEFGDGALFTGQSGEHAYLTPGLYSVKLTLTNTCLASSFNTRLVKVDNTIKPMVDLKAVPRALCPGEKVFYFDNANHSDYKYSYSIIFGDGSALNNIRIPQDTLFQTLSTHIYPNSGTYNFKFIASNHCGNKDSIFGPLSVNTTPKIPFYFFDNSTAPKTDKIGDWSERKMPFDCKFIIPVRWDAWPGIDSTLTVFFFWREFDPGNPDAAGDPVGYVNVKIKNIINDGVDTIVAFVPYDMTQADSVGVVVAWYCNHRLMDGMPNVFVTPVSGVTPVKSTKVIPSGIVNFGVKYAPGIVIPSDAFNGTCKMLPHGNWNYKVEDNNYYVLGMHRGDTEEKGYYEFHQSPTPDYNSTTNMISKGSYFVKNDTLVMQGMNDCYASGFYKFSINGPLLTLNMINDSCRNRATALNQKQYAYFEAKNNEGDRTGCPGDKVRFMLAGGNSCKWDFGDGSPMVNGNVVDHVYANVGTYIARAIVSNSCNRNDTLKSVVRIANTNIPKLNFDIDKYWIAKGDTLHTYFWASDGKDIDNNRYKWEFGDGISSTFRNAKHVYQMTGGYDIKLTVMNGCGTSVATRHIEVGNRYGNCSLYAKYFIQKADTAKLYPNVPVKFMNASIGKANKFSWNFNDGTLDTAANPIHIFTRNGYYKVCLSVYNDSTKCSDQICMDILVGQQPCKADYDVIVNNTTNTVQFIDKSIKATQWLWDYKDGKIDTIPYPTHVYSNTGVYEVCLSTYDKSSGCQSKLCQAIPVGKIDSTKYCKAAYSYFVDNSILQVSFKNESVGKIVKGYWNLGDGYFAYEENPVHKYAKPGLYHVCGSIVDSAGCQSEICKDIQVGALSCNADFNYFVDPATREVKFTSKDIGQNIRYFWDFGNGSTSNLENPSIKYSVKGLYKVNHTIIDTISKCRSDKSLEISIGEVLCNADFSFIIDPASRNVKFAITSDSTVRKQWDFGDGKMDSIVRPAHQYLKDGVYQVCLNVYNPVNHCVSSKCENIVINSQTTAPILDADFAYMSESNTLKTEFNDKSTGKVRRYYWDFGDGKSDTTANPIHTYIKPGIYKVCELVADSAKNVSQECKDVTVQIALCKTDFNFFVNSGSLSVQLNDLSSGSVKEHYWDLGDGKFSIKKDVLNTYAQVGTYKVCKSIIDSSNCKASVCKDIQVGNLACKAAYSYFVETQTNNVKFTDQSVGDITSYFWDFGDGAFSNVKDPSHIYQKPGIYKVCQSVKNSANGCLSDMCLFVQVGSVNCEADFTYVVDALSGKVSLQNTSKGDIKRYYWESGTGLIDTTENAQFTYAANGNYNVCLQVFNPNSDCKSNKCKIIPVIKDTSKMISFASDFTFFVVVDSNKIVLNDKSSGDPNNWYWTFGDGTFEKAKNAAHVYTKTGMYRICHSIYKSSTGEFNELCKEINIGKEQCSLTAAFNKFIDVKTQSIFLSDNSQGTVHKWFWLFGDGGSSQKQNPVHAYTKPGYYFISLAVRDTVKGCTGFYADLVQIGNLECKAAYEYIVDMNTNKLTLKNTSLGNVAKYYWEFGNKQSSVETNPEYTYPDAGLYRVSLVASSEDASCKDFYSQAIQVGTINCSADFEYYVDSLTNVAYFKNKTVGTATKYLWMFGDGYISELTNPTHKYTAPGYYKVGLNTYNPVNGCMDYNDKVILVGSEGIDCSADFIYQIDEANKTVKFYDKSNGKGLKYRWHFGDKTPTDTTANPVHSYTVGGFFNVCLTIYAANGVQNTACKIIKVAPEATKNCLAEFVFNVDSTSKTVYFTDKSTGNVDKWLWIFGDNSTSDAASPDHVYSAAGYYNVGLIVKNQSTGCTNGTARLINVADINALRAGFSYGLDTMQLKSTGTFPVTFVGLSNGDAPKFVWDFGDGTKDSTTTSPTHNYEKSGPYNVCLTVSDPVTQQANTYCTQIYAGPLAVKPVAVQEGLLRAYPTLFTEHVTIECYIPGTEDFQLVLFDVSGRLVCTISNGIKNTGKQITIDWDGSDLSGGTYYLKLISMNKIIKTVVLVKK